MNHNYVRVKTENDVEFIGHEAVAKAAGLILLKLADSPILPFDFMAYSDRLENFIGYYQQWT